MTRVKYEVDTSLPDGWKAEHCIMPNGEFRVWVQDGDKGPLMLATYRPAAKVKKPWWRFW